MGPERDDEDPDRGRGSTPKLRLAGRLDGEMDGQPVSVVMESQNLVLTVERLRTLLTIRHGCRSLVEPLRAFLTRSDIRLIVRIRWLGAVEVLPNPPFWVRMLLPRE